VAQRFRALGLDQFSPRSFPHSPHDFAGAVGVFPEDVVDVFEGLFEQGHWEGGLRNICKGVSECGSGASGVSNISFLHRRRGFLSVSRIFSHAEARRARREEDWIFSASSASPREPLYSPSS
jgi:hypothetical protein